MPIRKAAEPQPATAPKEVYVVTDDDFDCVSADTSPYEDNWPTQDAAMEVASDKVAAHGSTYYVFKAIARVQRAKPVVDVVTL